MTPQEQIELLIPDVQLRKLIFGTDSGEEILNNAENYINFFSNILLITTLLVHILFINWKKNHENSQAELRNRVANSNSVLRIYNMLDLAYDPNRISGEFIDDFITNLSIDYMLDKRMSLCENSSNNFSFVQMLRLRDFFNFEQNNHLSSYLWLLKRKRLSSKFESNFTFDQLIECIKMFSYLKETKVDFEPFINQNMINLYKVNLDINSCADLKNLLPINMEYSIIYDDFLGTYYLENFEFEDNKKFDENNEKNQNFILKMINLNNQDSFTIILKDAMESTNTFNELTQNFNVWGPTVVEDFIIDYDIINITIERQSSFFFKDYILLNNQYIKTLSIVISDALTIESKNQIMNTFHSKYKDIFEKMSVTSLYYNNAVRGSRWDEIVLLLMLEEGIFNFIRFVMIHSKGYDYYNAFLNSFYLLFSKAEIDKIVQSDSFLEDPTRFALETHSNSKYDCMAKAIIKIASKLHEKYNYQSTDALYPSTIYPTTIDDVILEIQRIYQSETDKTKKIIYMSNVILRVLNFLKSFYKKVIQYSQNREDFLIKSKDNFDFQDYKEYQKAKNELFNVFDTESEYSYKKTYAYKDKEDSAKMLAEAFDILVKFNNEYRSKDNPHHRQGILYDTLGKNKFFSNRKMLEFKEKISCIILKETQNNLKEFYEVINDFVKYLKYGIDVKESQIETKYFWENSIYPLVGQYCSGVTSIDGYKYSYFKINADAKEEKNFNVKMIIDDEFDFGNLYYCVPNINRVAKINDAENDRIWISPIIIPCYYFIPKLANHIQNLSEEEDYLTAIEMIYESDPLLYKNLFGSIENAQKVMPYLFDDSNSKYYKNHYYIVKKKISGKNEVIAIACKYKDDNLFWNEEEIIIKAFDESGVERPSTFGKAMKILKNSYTQTIGSYYSMIDDVCVREDFRLKGYGKAFILYLLKLAEKDKEGVKLIVYCHNAIAINLYSSLGFVIEREIKDEVSEEQYYEMIKL